TDAAQAALQRRALDGNAKRTYKEHRWPDTPAGAARGPLKALVRRSYVEAITPSLRVQLRALAMPSTSSPLPRISEQIWDMKYRLKGADGSPLDVTVADTWTRVAKAVAAAEPKRERKLWAHRFAQALNDFAFLPAGRILAGAGTGRTVTLFNCFVMGRIEDDLSSIFDNVREAARTMQQGGGIGHDFSTLRPKGALVKSIGADASGPVSFMDVW